MKPKISAKGTYVFNEDDLNQLGDLSFTSVIADMADSVEQAKRELRQSWCDQAAAATQTDPEINELLEGASAPSDARPNDGAGEPDLATRSETAEATEDLIDPELVFPELHLKS